MPVVRFLGSDIARIEGSPCECGRSTFRVRVIGRRDDMFIVRGVNVYPTAVLAVVGEFRPRVTGRARVIRRGPEVSIQPPVPIEVEVPAAHASDASLAAEIENAIHTRLTFRCKVELIPEAKFGESGYKTKLTVTRS
jgi:phenylacetate-CoA ligase